MDTLTLIKTIENFQTFYAVGNHSIKVCRLMGKIKLIKDGATLYSETYSTEGIYTITGAMQELLGEVDRWESVSPWQITKATVDAQNEAGKNAVTINCSHIGDDNDYSCFVSQTAYKMYEAGLKDEAYRLFMTDPMAAEEMSREGFDNYMAEQKAWKAMNERSAADHCAAVNADG